MSKIAVISYADGGRKNGKTVIAGKEVSYIYRPRNRRRLKRLLSADGIEKAALVGNAPDYAIDVLNRKGIKIFTGERFLNCVVVRLIAGGAKLGGNGFCTLYDDFADEKTVEIIKSASDYFKNISLCTASDNIDWIYDEIIESTGLALSNGEFGGVGIVRSGIGGGQRVKINITSASGALFSDENGNSVTPSVAEAVAGDELDENVLERLNLKIRSLC